MLGRKVIYMRYKYINGSYNNIAKGIRLLDKIARIVYTGKSSYSRQKKRNAPLIKVRLSGRSQVIGYFSLYQCKGKSGTAAPQVLCNQASKLYKRKLVMNQVGVNW